MPAEASLSPDKKEPIFYRSRFDISLHPTPSDFETEQEARDRALDLQDQRLRRQRQSVLQREQARAFSRANSTGPSLASSPIPHSSTISNITVAMSTNNVQLTGRNVGPTGYGLMGFTWRPDPVPQQQAISSMKAAVDHGATFWNGGEIYGTADRNSLHLLGEYFTQYPEDRNKIVISIKGGAEKNSMKWNGKPENVRRSIEECIRVLNDKKLDIWECARVDISTPIEITMREADKYVQSGQIGGVGLSECSADTIIRASRITKIAAVEVEFSLWETTILNNGIAKACAERGIPIVAYGPLGQGFLTGQIKTKEDVPERMRAFPRFQGANFAKNLDLVHEIEAIANKKNATPAQIALAWVRAQGSKPGMPTFIPIPGATTVERVKENTTVVELSKEELAEIDEVAKSAQGQGDRYPAHLQAMNFGSTPALEK